MRLRVRRRGEEAGDGIDSGGNIDWRRFMRIFFKRTYYTEMKEMFFVL